MKKQIRTMKREFPLPQKWLKKALFIVLLFSCKLIFAQVQPEHKVQVSPNGVMDDMYDLYGNKYTLKDLIIENANVKSFVTSINCGCFTAYFEAGCGMGETNLIETPRRDVLCKLLTDLSDFITPTNPAKRVNIWVRNIASAPNIGNPATSNVLGMATSFFNLPSGTNTITGGIIDNTAWGTIISGTDSYTNIAGPIMPTSGGVGFYHAMMAFNFSNPANIDWNTNLGTTNMPGQYDLYTVMLHEMVHALGFASLIDLGGNSVFGFSKNYKSRYDLLLKSSNNLNILSTPSVASPMYNYLVNSSLNSSIFGTNVNNGGCISDVTSCNNAIKYVGSTTQKIYNPNCYEKGSSLSHFEDQCLIPDQNNQYFVMSNQMGKNVVKRFLKPEERQVLCDLGYKVQSIYGSGTTLHNYNTSMCNSGMVVGINDGLNGSNYTYMYDGTNSLNILPLANDYSQNANNLRIEGVQQIIGTYDILSNTVNSITFKPSSPGLSVLRYVPYDYNTGIRGNITYIYVFNPHAGCEPNTCFMVNNGNFESSESIDCYMGIGNYLVTLDCWYSYVSDPDLFSRNTFEHCSYSIPTNFSIPLGETYDNEPSFTSTNNKHFIGLVGQTTGEKIQEGIQTQLSSPFTDGNKYKISFWAKVANDSYFANSNGNIDICGLQGILSPALSYDPTNPNIEIFGNVQVPANGNWTYCELTYTHYGSPLNALLLAFAAYRQPTNITRYIYIDDVKVSLADLSVTFNPPSSICQNSQPLNLTSYVQPPGGSFSGLGVTGNLFNPNTSGIGSSSTILYTYTNPTSGCPVTVPATISVNPAPIASINGAATSCDGSLNYNITQAPSTTYTWSANNGAIMSPATGPSSTLSNITNNTTITLVATNQYGCSSSSTKDVAYCCPAPIGVQMFTNPNTTIISNYLQTLGNNTVCISGTWTVNASATYSNKTFLMEPNAKIIINDGQTLTLTERCLVKSNCNYMWDGIYVTNSTQRVVINNSTVNDAIAAVNSTNKGYYDIKGSYFYDNYISISVKNSGYTINQPLYTGSVYGTAFASQRTTGLLPPKAGQLAYIGIDAMDMYGLTIGDEAQGVNIFNNLFCGIRGTDAWINVANSNFNNMITSGAGNPITYGDYNTLFNKTAIHVTKTKNGLTIVPTGLKMISINTPCTFTNCSKSIYTYKSAINIENNSFSLSSAPINIIDPSSGGTISRNTILSGSAIAISVKKIDPSGVLKFTIASNNITNPTSKGVFVQNCYSYNASIKVGVVDNNVTFSSASSINRYGVQVQNCNNIDVKCNEVSNTVNLPSTTDRKLVGLSIESCQGAGVYNNDNLRKLGAAIRGVGILTATGFTCNKMFDSNYGIYFEPNSGNTATNISSQGSEFIATDNQWSANMAADRRINGGLNNSGNNWYTRPGIAATSNTYWTGINAYHPLVTKINPVYCSSGFASNCMTCTTGTGGGGAGTLLAKQQQLEPIVSDQISYTTLEPEFKEYEKSYAYTEITRNPQLTKTGSADDALLKNFADYIKNTNIGTFESINQLIENSDIETAILKNANVIAQQLTETNKKYVNDVYLNKICKNTMLSEVEKAALTDIALLTPYIGGSAVYTARAIMGIDPDANSLTFGSIGQISQIASDSSLTCKIYPNPASSEVSIEITHSEKPVLVRIVNTLGVEVIKRNITLSNGVAKLDVSVLSNGMYYCIVYVNNERIEQQRLVISK